MRLWTDPRRWVDSDMEKAEYLLLAKWYAVLAVVITVLAILLGVFLLP